MATCSGTTGFVPPLSGKNCKRFGDVLEIRWHVPRMDTDTAPTSRADVIYCIFRRAMGVLMKSFVVIGVFFALLGIAALVFPAFWTSNTKEVARLGDVTVQNRENVLHVIPPAASIGAIVLGGCLIVAGVVLKDRD
jgi:hypothetical protein